MPTFAYSARDESGRLVKGLLEAESQALLAERLRKMGYLVTRVEEARASLSGLPRLTLSRVSPDALVLAMVQLANMVEAGVPLVSSVQTVASQTTCRPLRTALEAVVKDIEGGSTFSASLARRPSAFPKLMAAMAAVGEASGKLDVVLTRFCNFLEKDLALSRSVKGSMTYPLILLVAATALIIFIVSVVIPQFADLFVKVGIELPGPTRLLVFIGTTIKTRWWAILLGVAGGSAAAALLAKVPSVRLRLDRLVLRVPVIGSVIYQTLVARFARTLGTMVGAGLPILNALETSEGVLGNKVLEQEIRRVRSAVERGERMAATLSIGKVLQPDAIQMIRVGEESGRLDAMLDKIAEYYELRVTYSLKQLTTVLEPMLLAGMGAVVAFVMASLLLPLFDMVKLLQTGGMR